MAGVVGHLSTLGLERLAIVVRAFQVNARDDDHRTLTTNPVGVWRPGDQQAEVHSFRGIVAVTVLGTAS